MQTNELTHLLVALLAGVMLGVIGTVAAYTAVGGRPGDAERQETEEALKEAQEERNEAVTRMNEYLEAEQRKGQNVDLGGGGDDVPQPQGPAAIPAPAGDTAPKHAEATPAPRTGGAAPATSREVAPAPRPQGTGTKTAPPPASGFGPPKHYGD